MEMKHGLHLQQKTTLVMTQRLQQALKLLQVPTLELQQILQQEMQQNPLLEEIVEYEDAETEVPESEPTEPAEPAEPAEPEPDPDAEISPKAEAEKSLAEWEEYWQGDSDGHYGRGEVQSAEDFYDKVPVTQVTLADHLTTQFRLATSDPELVRIGEYLIGNMDERGYLMASDEEAAAAVSAEVAKVKEAIALLQSLDPPGVGARDLRECLLIQLKARGHAGTLAYQVVDREFENLRNGVTRRSRARSTSRSSRYRRPPIRSRP